MRNNPLRSLRFAARPGVLAHHLGLLLIPLGVLFLVPAAVAGIGGRRSATALQLLAAAVLVSLGELGRRRGQHAALQRNEALAVTALAFCVASLAASLPLTAFGLSPLDAWFEATSGITTTGLSILTDVERAPAALVFARAWLQWIGGLGVLVLALALVITPGASARRMGFEAREVADVAGGTRAHARRVLLSYLGLTALGTALLAALGMGPFDALLHTFAAVSTGGFGTRTGSLAGLSGFLQAAVMALCIAGAIAFSWYYLSLFRRPGKLLADPRSRSLFLACGAVAAALFGIAQLAGGAAGVSLGDLALTAVSAQTTAGFSSTSPAELPAAAQVVVVGSMLVGGEIGSTAGGMKLFRALVLLRLLLLLLDRASIPPSGRLSLRVGYDRIESDEVQGVVAVAVAYVALVGLSWLAFLLHGHAPLASLFEVASAVGTVGLSTGLTGAALEPALKVVLCLDMLMGRVEVIAFLLLVRPATWWGRRRRT